MKLFKFILLITTFSLYSQNLREVDSIKIYIDWSKKEVYNNKKKAIEYLNKAKKFYNTTYLETYLADIEYQQGVINYVSADYKEALESFLKALEIYQRNKKISDVAKCYTGIGLVEMGIENSVNAQKFFNKSLKIKHPLADKMNAANLLNLGILQMDQKKYDSAKYYFKKSYKLSLKANRIDTEQMLLNRLGQLFLEINQLDSSFYYYNKLFNHKETISNWEKTAGHRGLADYYLKIGQIDKAEGHAKVALALALNIPSKWEIYKCYEILGEVSLKNSNPVQAYKYLKLHNTYKDSVVNENTIRKIKFLQLQDKENENQRLALEKEKIENELGIYRFVLIFIVVMSLVLGVTAYLFKKEKDLKNKYSNELQQVNKDIESKNQKLTELNQTKTILLSVLSHDLRSPLVGIDQVLTLSSQEILSKDEKDELLTKLQTQVKDTISMLNNMIHWAQSQKDGFTINPSEINPEIIIKNVIKNLQINADLKNNEIKFVMGHPIVFKFDPTHFQIIIQNLLNNAIKFSYNNTPIIIEVIVERFNYCVNVIAQGVGLSYPQIEKILDDQYKIDNIQESGVDKSTGIGLTLVKSLLKLNHSKLKIESITNHTTTFSVCIPKDNV